MAILSGGALRRGSAKAWETVQRALLIPRVAWLGSRTTRDLLTGWNHYWSGIGATGVGGDVLWDAGDLDEMSQYLPVLLAHADTSLPIVDIGCGNGRFTRQLAAHFPSVTGLDLSPDAVALAERESAGLLNMSFRPLDATVPGSTAMIAQQVAPANVFVRGVLHILTPAARVEMARNLLPLVGSQGRVFLAETNFRGGSLAYMQSIGATPRRIPEPLERAIRDLPRPGHFGAQERASTFPSTEWKLLEDGPTVIETIPLRGPTEPEEIPGYYAVLAPLG